MGINDWWKRGFKDIWGKGWRRGEMKVWSGGATQANSRLNSFCPLLGMSAMLGRVEILICNYCDIR